MQKNIHPQYFDDAKVSCVCGNSFTTGATVPEIRVEICSNCHPFFTGEMKFVDTLGKVEKFQQAQKKAKDIKAKKQEVVKAREERKRPESLKEMFDLAKKQASS
ncbi:MAG TPA: 50S ribosomal protein L31 [Candidatus Saccharimonadales bacterium]|nr:50S ribosomal protein L31 [Candidatus Saccharimonadales bacterium]